MDNKNSSKSQGGKNHQQHGQKPVGSDPKSSQQTQNPGQGGQQGGSQKQPAGGQQSGQNR